VAGRVLGTAVDCSGWIATKRATGVRLRDYPGRDMVMVVA
jgi:hypothetical protein